MTWTWTWSWELIVHYWTQTPTGRGLMALMVVCLVVLAIQTPWVQAGEKKPR